MKHRAHHGWRERPDDLNRGDYRGDFGPEGHHHFSDPGHDEHSRRSHRSDHAGWERSRVSGGYGSQYGAWTSGAGVGPAGFGFGPEEEPHRGGFADEDWQVTRPARGRGAWAGDWAQENYRGRGPKGYRRSDERIRDEVCERLSDDWSVDASEITVEVRDGEVILSGEVSTRDQKRRAAECAESVHGVEDVFNRLRVARADRRDMATTGRGEWR